MFIRLSDAKEQFIKGKWQITYGGTNDVFVFPDSTRNEAEIKDQRIYIVSGARQIYDVGLKNVHGRIETISQNPLNTYLFLQQSTTSSTQFCLVDRSELYKNTCEQVNVSNKAKGIWNPKKDHELVFLTEEGEIVTYDPWENKPKRFFADIDKAAYKELRKFFDTSGVPLVENKNVTRISRFLNFLWIRGDKKSYFTSIPLFAKVGILSDQEHILVVESNRVDVIELPTGKRAKVIEENKIGNFSFFWHNDDGDHVLR